MKEEKEILIEAFANRLLFSKKGTNVIPLIYKHYNDSPPIWFIEQIDEIKELIEKRKEVLSLERQISLFKTLFNPEEIKTRIVSKEGTVLKEVTTTSKPANIPPDIALHLLNTMLGRNDTLSEAEMMLENSPLLIGSKMTLNEKVIGTVDNED